MSENDPRPPEAPLSTDSDEALARTRRGFLEAVLVAIGAAFMVALLWLLSRDAPSAGRDSEFTPPALAPTQPEPAATASPPAT